MGTYGRGLYEELISAALEQGLGRLPEGLVPLRSALRSAEAGDRLALFLARIVERAVDDIAEKERVERGLSLARALVATLASELGRDDLRREAPVRVEPILRALRTRLPDGTPETIEAPLIPLLDTTLLTNAPGEPRVGHQLLTEIASAERIDVVMAFIRRSGIRPLLDAFRRHCERRKGLRVLTTTYTGSTELAALQLLEAAGAEVRVSYDATGTRLHAKAWLFHRGAGLPTAYVGSSNLTHSAQVSGLEWNVRASGARNPDLVAKIAAVFEAYWESGDFVPFVASEFSERSAVTEPAARLLLSPVEIRLEPFQERLLEEIDVARERGRHRNLLVSATGTGKTVMAAVDYARLREHLGRSRLLFVAHRQELLDQSRATYAQALRNPGFGELWVGRRRPERWDHVFASIQSLGRSGLEDLAPDHFGRSRPSGRRRPRSSGVSARRGAARCGPSWRTRASRSRMSNDGSRGWSDLREAAGLPLGASGPEEEALRRACGRLLHLDDSERLETYGEILRSPSPPAVGDVAPRRARLLRMLVASVCGSAVTKETSLETGIALLWQHPQVRSELVELFELLADRIDHRHYELGDAHPEVPLRIHARYSRLEILAAFRPEARAHVPAWQSGLYWVPEAKADLFAFTLDKTSGQFSPTTRYRDYAISPQLVHWESQSVTRADSETGRRYQQHARLGSSVMLFARERADQRAFWFLGPATYVRHEGERPMAITWRLGHALPGDLYASFAAAVA